MHEFASARLSPHAGVFRLLFYGWGSSDWSNWWEDEKEFDVEKAGAVPRLFVQVEYLKEPTKSLLQQVMEDWKKELTAKSKDQKEEDNIAKKRPGGGKE